MNKIIAAVLFILLILWMIPVCAEEVLVSKDTLLSMYDLPNPEYVDGFIRDYSITEEYAKYVDMTSLYRSYVARREAEKSDYTYLLNAAEIVHTGSLDKDNISKILWFWNPNAAVEVRLFDLEENKIYYGDYNILNNISGAPARELTETEYTRAMDILEQNAVMDWQANYPSTGDDTTGWLFWMLTIEYKDGSMFQSSGSGSTADNLPGTYSQVRAAFQNFIEE